ncbi:hypothetical protein L2E82_26474 [Cichorium intybus]|uniref:Uncharacterized protein n=1 Tax=Cichorium intybus TaxID=13427 RepID=A0ACB9CQZ5_CICIN|nr:hypothetical protein L2E82_26474 [Cichorium intybus]
MDRWSETDPTMGVRAVVDSGSLFISFFRSEGEEDECKLRSKYIILQVGRNVMEPGAKEVSANHHHWPWSAGSGAGGLDGIGRKLIGKLLLPKRWS